ncbi:hypothetical protein [Actinoallomurus sp. NPDC052274]|uniref:hypothetical protein n=1 Tax=Actinoallomurus sp. NPDC052274 TaxID=3155420 RepID=UPI00341370BE
MALLTLTAQPLQKALPLNLTGALVSLGANTGVTFVNTGREILAVSVGATPTTPTSDIWLTIQGQSVPGVSGGPLATNAIALLGPWPSQFNRTDGSYQVQVDFSAQTNVSVALLQVPGVA